MTLIEVLFFYRDMIKGHGRSSANFWLSTMCSTVVADNVIASVSDSGDFIGSDNRIVRATWNYSTP